MKRVGSLFLFIVLGLVPVFAQTAGTPASANEAQQALNTQAAAAMAAQG